MDEKIVEKIKKLLRLSTSSNEHEGKAALLKAKELMAEHKLSVEDLDELRNRGVKMIVTDVTYSGRKDPWISRLSQVIAENYCCGSFFSKQKGLQTRLIGFVGLEGDIDLCITIFKYAVDCIHAGQKRLKTNLGDKPDLVGYGSGFVEGISRSFEEQKRRKSDEWGLVMQVPTEVENAMRKDFKKASLRSKALDTMTATGYQAGLEDGKKFDPGTRLDDDKKKSEKASLMSALA